MRLIALLGLVLLITPLSHTWAQELIGSTLPPFTLMVKALKPADAEGTEVRTLLPENADPHDFHLRPSHMRALRSSDRLIWGGAQLEPHLEKVIHTLPAEKVINLQARMPALHFWLSPTQTARRLDMLSELLEWPVPAHLSKRLTVHDENLRKVIHALEAENIQIWVFHAFLDALETDYGLSVLALAKGDHGLSARRMRTLENTTMEKRCLILDPEWVAFENKTWVHAQFPVRVNLDPLFRKAKSLDEIYFTLINALKSCLSQQTN